MVTDKARENRVRQLAERRGLRLEKSRRRDTRAIGYGRYRLFDSATGALVTLGGDWLSLMEVEEQMEMLSAVQDPARVRLIRAVAALGMAMSPMAGLDPRTMARLAGPVTAAANLLGDGTADELASAVGGILQAPPPAPPDVMKLASMVDELRAAYGAYTQARQRPFLARPLVEPPKMRDFR